MIRKKSYIRDDKDSDSIYVGRQDQAYWSKNVDTFASQKSLFGGGGAGGNGIGVVVGVGFRGGGGGCGGGGRGGS